MRTAALAWLVWWAADTFKTLREERANRRAWNMYRSIK